MHRRTSILTTCLTAAAVIFFSAFATAQAKGIAGDWTGDAVFNNNNIPLDLHFTVGGDGAISGTIDIQTAKGFALQEITFEGTTLKCTAALGNNPVEFTGTLGANGNSLEGTFAQGPNSGTFSLKRGLRPVVFADDIINAEKMATAWKGMSDYTVEMAEMMPEEHYPYKPVEVLRSWAEQCNHITNSNYFFANSIFGTQRMPPVTVTEKAAVIAEMKKSFELIQKALESWEGKDMREVLANGKTKFQTFLFMTDHLTHTRGIMIMYLRMKDMAPPQFRTY